MNHDGQDKIYPLTVDLAEWRLFQRLRQIRKNGENVILFIRATDCKEVGNMPVVEMITRFNSGERG
jgi:hypothetical protein